MGVERGGELLEPHARPVAALEEVALERAEEPLGASVVGPLSLRDIDRVTWGRPQAPFHLDPMYTAPPSVWATRGLSSVGPTMRTRSSSIPHVSSASGCLETLQHTGHPSKQWISDERWALWPSGRNSVTSDRTSLPGSSAEKSWGPSSRAGGLVFRAP